MVPTMQPAGHALLLNTYNIRAFLCGIFPFFVPGAASLDRNAPLLPKDSGLLPGLLLEQRLLNPVGLTLKAATLIIFAAVRRPDTPVTSFSLFALTPKLAS